MVLDEPTTGLDPQVRHMIWGRLRDLRQAGKTLLLTTHYMEEAERLCDELIIMDQGRILEQGTPAALIKKHAEPEVIEVRGEEKLARRRWRPPARGASRRWAIPITFTRATRAPWSSTWKAYRSSRSCAGRRISRTCF